jgi:glyoxylase-like metal-dependent hydrolase (beta-lactamase superfamily II)
VLVLGDVLFGHHPLTSRPGPHEPPAMFTLDADRNRASARKVAALRPSLVCFGHGPPLRDGGVLTEFVARLPRTAASSGESNDFGDRTALRPGTRDATPDL